MKDYLGTRIVDAAELISHSTLALDYGVWLVKRSFRRAIECYDITGTLAQLPGLLNPRLETTTRSIL